MRKILIGVLILLLTLLAGVMLLNKLQVGKLELLGVSKIIEKNDELDQKIQETTRVATIEYTSAQNALQKAGQNLQEKKTEYNENINLYSEDGQVIKQIQSYEVEYLWTKLGNYATKNGIVLKIDVTVNNSNLGTYDLNFALTGSYIGITEFIYDLNNDSTLLFKVDNFNLTQEEGTGNLLATFICRDISINLQNVTTNNSKISTENDINGNIPIE